jgi:hypothetical protein
LRTTADQLREKLKKSEDEVARLQAEYAGMFKALKSLLEWNARRSKAQTTYFGLAGPVLPNEKSDHEALHPSRQEPSVWINGTEYDSISSDGNGIFDSIEEHLVDQTPIGVSEMNGLFHQNPAHLSCSPASTDEASTRCEDADGRMGPWYQHGGWAERT